MLATELGIVTEAINNNIKENYIDYNKLKFDIRDKLGKNLYKQTG